jgi:hypothetical protein
VKILLEASTPAPLAWALKGHKVTCAFELGWQALENGALLDAAEGAGFEILLACDQHPVSTKFHWSEVGRGDFVHESLANPSTTC